jgi:hypothetical protein
VDQRWSDAAQLFVMQRRKLAQRSFPANGDLHQHLAPVGAAAHALDESERYEVVDQRYGRVMLHA